MGKTAKNDITHDKIRTKHNSDAYRKNAERIFGKTWLEKKIEEENREKMKEEKTND